MSTRAAVSASWKAATRLAKLGTIEASPAAIAGMLLERARGSARLALRNALAVAFFLNPSWIFVVDELAQCVREEEDKELERDAAQ